MVSNPSDAGTPLREIQLGDIQFLNSWPVTYALRQGIAEKAPGVRPGPIRIVSGTPTELNRKLLTGELDASCVSSVLYLRHLEELVPVPSFCIRSDGGIHSVLLVSRIPLKELKGKTLGLTNQAATTPILLNILLLRRGLKVNQEVTPLRFPEILKAYPAALLIGDEALFVSQSSGDWFTWDLAQGWADWTKLPFVFALWVVRRRLVKEQPEILTELADSLRASYEWAKAHPQELLGQMHKTFPLEANFLKEYLSRLSYELDSKAWRALKRFAQETERIGEIPKGATRKIGRSTCLPVGTNDRPIPVPR